MIGEYKQRSDNTIIGVIYPFPEELIDRLFINQKDIFIKYIPHEPTKKSKIKLQSGMKIYFYVPKSKKAIIGEATIEEISYMKIKDILKNYESRIIPTEKKLIEYSNHRENKKAQVLVLTKVIKYKKDKFININITMAGIYVDSDNKSKIFGE